MCSSLGCLIALQVLLYRHLLALTVRNPLLVLWRPNTAALRKVSIRIINASVTGKEEDDP